MYYFISSIISLGVGLVIRYWLKGSHEIAAQSLQLKISKSTSPIPCATARYHTVYLTVNKGSKYCQLLSLFHIPVSLLVSGTVRWVSSDGGIRFPSDLYPVGPGKRVQEYAYNFIITPNTEIVLAVAKEKNSEVCPLGRNEWAILANCDYDLYIDLFVNNKPLPSLIIEKYIEANTGEIVNHCG